MRPVGKRVLVLFFITFLLTLLITAPAALLDKWLQSVTNGRLLLANSSGTLWHGAATPAARQQHGELIVLHPMHWDIAIAPLFTGKIKARVQWDDLPPSAAMQATIAFGQLELQNVLFRLPAQVLEEISPILKPAQFRGQFQVQSDNLAYSGNGLNGNAVVDWNQASSALSSVVPLGNYRLTLAAAENRIRVNLTTTSGALLLQGQGNLSTNQGLEFQGTAQAAEGKYDRLKALLHHLGPEVTSGVHSFRLTPQ